jgi:hypothetical protein
MSSAESARSVYHREERGGNHMQEYKKKARNSPCKELKHPGYQIQEQ